jgi:hypothetical protein
MDPMKRKNYSFDNLKKCFKDCSGKFNQDEWWDRDYKWINNIHILIFNWFYEIIWILFFIWSIFYFILYKVFLI